MNQGTHKPAVLLAAELTDSLCPTTEALYSVERYIEIFGITPAVFADQVAAYRRSGPGATSESDAEAMQRFIGDVLQVILAIDESGVAVERAITWFRLEPLPAFEQQTAEQLVSQGQVERVLQFLASWQAGSQA
ncbi:TPA: DUF2384 domain-containing protein [Pseudomonas aeruginosa]|uniref:hypothetical protein n=1 Tax=Pseudomonas aeruginosa TaxID=287 RepID=UPI0021E1AFF0|nr:hypothetical protein [Pseudomonas aeruginosa]GLF14355.1 hypothetical protein VNPA131289_10400 [Pseudomonas aeruginosa]GLF26711.1 hypothetical protein VNPA141486_13110 [Pseudomonas aeruginosa]GLF55588.1 hypothetical protein VNPA141818_61000 [Pseudomonas aeruginosa]HBO6797123.1 DUF2384 domain-containing protein [Pseudomonas aeruginosa]HBO6798942.1 DUF2384 domain-containing protein [Pseudomonas aeruginosa]